MKRSNKSVDTIKTTEEVDREIKTVERSIIKLKEKISEEGQLCICKSNLEKVISSEKKLFEEKKQNLNFIKSLFTDDKELYSDKYFEALKELRSVNYKIKNIICLKDDINKFSKHLERLVDRKKYIENNPSKKTLESIKKEKAHNEQINLLKSKSRALDDRTRDFANSIKKQIEITSNCPYCFNAIGLTPHADHIYPIKHGGISHKSNIVYVCSDCNLKKRDMTLREFINKFSLDRDRIEKQLEILGKKF